MPTALSATRDESAMRFFLDSPSLDRPEGQLDRGDLIMNNRKRFGLALSLTTLAGLLAMMPRSDEGAVLVLPDTEYLVSAGELGALHEWPPDANFIADRYWPGSGYEFGYPMHYPADWRPFYEDAPWHSDPSQRERILPELPPGIPPDSVLP
jgi:hypothetical protein